MSQARESILHELDRQMEIHADEVRRLGVSVLRQGVRLVRDTWQVPVEVSNGKVDSSDVMAFLRVIRKSVRQKSSFDVSVFIDADEESPAA